jgi:hypothetical protein
MRQSTAAVGSAASFVVAPGTVVGLIPWLITRRQVFGLAMDDRGRRGVDHRRVHTVGGRVRGVRQGGPHADAPGANRTSRG